MKNSTSDVKDFTPVDIAFGAYVDSTYLKGFLVLLKSLVSKNSWFNLPFIVLHTDLTDADFIAIKDVYPNVIIKTFDSSLYSTFIKGKKENYLYEKAYYSLEFFRPDNFDRIIYMDCDMLVRSDISELTTLQGPFAATEQFYHNDDGKLLNSGLLIIDRPVRNDDVFNAFVEIGRAGTYDVEKHDQGILNAYFKGEFVRIPWGYNAVKRRFPNISKVPDEVVILHYTGPVKPWTKISTGSYAVVDKEWKKADVALQVFWKDAILKATKAKNSGLAAYYLKRKQSHGPVDLATYRPVLELLLAEGNFEDAEVILSGLSGSISVLSYYLGTIEIAKGNFVKAERLLLDSIEGDSARREKALTSLVEMAWRSGNTQSGLNYLAELSEIVPGNSSIFKLQDKILQSDSIKAEREATRPGSPAHVAFYMTPRGNSGDLMLPDCVRRAIAPALSADEFAPYHVHQFVTPQHIEEMNGRQAVVVGGGGLFLSDTSPNKVSGWQWNIPLDTLEELKSPLIFFAVGYNRFKGQAEFPAIFKRHLLRCVEKSSFFGLRNHGSIAAIKGYLPESLHERVKYQPCPTTLSKYLYPDLFVGERQRDTVALNVAYDRKDNRFGSNYRGFLAEMGKSIRELTKAHSLVYVSHAVGDEQFVLDIAREEGIYLKSVKLYDTDIAGLISFYRGCKLVIGMRGHAGMIPFGCQTPILSLVTHPKLRYFLEDVRLADWAINVENEFSSVLIGKVNEICGDLAASVDLVGNRIDSLRDVTNKNLEEIRNALS